MAHAALVGVLPRLPMTAKRSVIIEESMWRIETVWWVALCGRRRRSDALSASRVRQEYTCAELLCHLESGRWAGAMLGRTAAAHSGPVTEGSRDGGMRERHHGLGKPSTVSYEELQGVRLARSEERVRCRYYATFPSVRATRAPVYGCR